MQTLETSQIRSSAEFIGSLEAQERVSLQPQIQGRIERILVANGDRVTQGTPIILLSLDQTQANVSSAVAGVNSNRAALATAEAQLAAKQADRIKAAADVRLILLFGLGLVVVFLILAAQYENYIDPLIILLTVPVSVLGAIIFISLRGLVNDLYCQVAVVMLIGLASKNAILIVEFANQSREQGMTIAQAVLHAVQQRLRPILMTTIAALVGFLPLVMASGAGSASRWSLGRAIFGGLLVSTVSSLLLVPVLYVVVKNLVDFAQGNHPKPPQSPDSQQSAQSGESNGSGQVRSEAVLKSQGDAPA